ncbi:hypothetical protein M514_00412 [Trichuris suis]|uniref:Uncharacterized protein n=1 Tax=Trichuris suis TaxID=68888 RepID=A0A085NRA5_9BILA|nr:hypothetical protein M513_00412 [Trichuris suis]KFD72001.1 hypothetical protein M514_00412 [Trichuris suis]
MDNTRTRNEAEGAFRSFDLDDMLCSVGCYECSASDNTASSKLHFEHCSVQDNRRRNSIETMVESFVCGTLMIAQGSVLLERATVVLTSFD